MKKSVAGMALIAYATSALFLNSMPVCADDTADRRADLMTRIEKVVAGFEELERQFAGLEKIYGLRQETLEGIARLRAQALPLYQQLRELSHNISDPNIVFTDADFAGHKHTLNNLSATLTVLNRRINQWRDTIAPQH